MLEVEWTKEVMCLFTLIEGVSQPWPTKMLVFTASENTKSLCIDYPFVISPKHN